MNLSARADYAVRSMLVLAAVTDGRPLSGAAIAKTQDMPPKYVEQILVDLRRAGLVTSHRGADGGFRLARPAREITVADVLRATEGPLAGVRGLRPEELDYGGEATALREVWLAVRVSLRNVVEHVTLEQVVRGKLPARVARLARDPEATETRPTRPGVRAPGSARSPR